MLWSVQCATAITCESTVPTISADRRLNQLFCLKGNDNRCIVQVSRLMMIATEHCGSGVCFTKVFRTELGHKYILVECSVIALCLPVMSKLPVINSCALNRTMIGMSIKRISVLNLCHVLKPFVKSTPGRQHVTGLLRDIYRCI